MKIHDIMQHLSEEKQTDMATLSSLCNATSGEILRCISDTPDGWWIVERVPGVGAFDYRLRTVSYGYVPRVLEIK